MTVNFSSRKVGRLHCSHAILLYSDSTTEQALPTFHQVCLRESTKNLEILPGQILTPEKFDEIMRTVANQPSRREILPENVLFQDANSLCWWVPSAVRPIFFSTTDRRFQRELDAKRVLHPALVFLATHEKLNVWALEKSERPLASTHLCLAPYFNLYSDGAMCRGNTRYPSTLKPSDIPVWERAFFDTKFTHSNYHARFTNHPDGHNGLWRAMKMLARKAGVVFPADVLVKTQLTLDKIANPVQE